jgi:Na+/H+ antiporter NhaA
VIVPLFALANAGIAIDGGVLARAFRSPITLGILVGYVVGKPAGILGGSWLLTRLSRGRLQPPVGWAAVAGGGTIAGIGFTVALCWSPPSPSTAPGSRRRSSASSAPRSAPRSSPGCCSG